MSIRYYSTNEKIFAKAKINSLVNKVTNFINNKKTNKVTIKEALIIGQAPDKGLFMPETIPKLSDDEINSFRNMNYAEIAFEITNKFLEGELPKEELKKIVKDAYNFDVPIENVYDNKYIMRLDRGPTLSFKDFAARMMARLLNYFLKIGDKKLLVLVATSGDTGGAIANAFYGQYNVNVIVLFPKNEVSNRQRKQMTTLGKNIKAVAVNGKFDDCQLMVKKAFADPELKKFNLSSANSINFGRLLPQTVYYFHAYSKVAKDGGIIFSVPSGNFGDLMGGIIAMKMGLPVKKFIVAVNENDEFVKFLEGGKYKPIKPSKKCLSNAMNVGHPSNLARLIDLYNGQMDEKGIIHKMPNLKKMRENMFAISISDKETVETIKKVYEKYNVILEPHGAVAWAGVERYLEKNKRSNAVIVSFETAHPAKFPEELNKLKIYPELPENMKQIDKKEEIDKIEISNDYREFKKIIKP